MSLRFLLGILAPGPPDQQHDFQSSEIEIRPQDKDMYVTIHNNDIQNAAKFHIGMLSISLIIGLAFIGFTIWWMEKKPFLNYVINLIIALVCRTFFSILFDGVILLGSGNVAGGNALLAFEQIFINLVLAFWLSLTIYIHALVQRNFKSEPTLNLYRYGVPGAAVFFAFVWIFLLQAEFPSLSWWFVLNPSTQWVVNSFNLLCVLIQLALMGDMSRIMMKTSLDNDSMSLFRKAAILMGVLVFIFWLQFGLFMGRLPQRNSLSYTYFFYFVDGTECALVCLISYFFNDWVDIITDPDSSPFDTGVSSTASNNEELLVGSGGRGIVTLDSVFMTNESGKLKRPEDEGTRDVVYSNVVDPERWEKILDLYKRLNKVPNQQGTVVEGDEFYDCPLRTDGRMPKRTQRSISDVSRKRVSSEDRCVYKSDSMSDHIQKKNAFYSSKYLVLDSKGDVPKYLETRPSLSSMSGISLKEGRMSKDYSPGINSVKTEELVPKWLSDNSKNMPKKDSLTQRTEEIPSSFFSLSPLLVLDKKPSESDESKRKPNENRVSVTQKIISKIDSVLGFPSSENEERKNSAAKDEGSHKQEAILKDLSSNGSIEKSDAIKSEIEKKPAGSLNQSNKIPSSEESDKPREVPVGEPHELRSKSKMPSLSGGWLKDEEETPASNDKIGEQKYHEPKQSDAEDSKAKSTYLSQYLTNSELEERRMSRERGQDPKSIFSFPETISSLVDYFVNGRGSFFGQRTDPKLSDSENLPKDEFYVNIRREALKTDTKFQAEEQTDKPNTVPAKVIRGEERFPEKKASISSGSEFSIEGIYAKQEPEISISKNLPKSTAMIDTHSPSECTVESRKNSFSSSSSSSDPFSAEHYYQNLSNAKQNRERRNQQQLLKLSKREGTSRKKLNKRN